MNSLISIPRQLEEEAYLDHRGAMGLAGGQAFNPVWANETQTEKANLQRLEGKPISVPSHNIPSGFVFWAVVLNHMESSGRKKPHS